MLQAVRTPGAPLTRGRQAALAAALAVLLLLAGAASRTQSFPSEAPAAPRLPGLVLDVVLLLAILLTLLTAAAFAWALSARDGAERPPLSRRGFVRTMLAPLGFLLLAGGLLLARGALDRPAAEAPGGPAGAAGGGGALGAAAQHGTGQALGAVLLALLLAPAAAWLAFRWTRRWGEGRRRAAARAALRRAVEEALEGIEAEGDARRAVIAAYARMEAVLGAGGLPRRAAEAPLEYLARVVLEAGVPAAAAARLTKLFEWARFSQHPVDAGMKADALESLRAVRSALSQPAPAVAAVPGLAP
jgi:hypothetical protein